MYPSIKKLSYKKIISCGFILLIYKSLQPLFMLNPMVLHVIPFNDQMYCQNILVNQIIFFSHYYF